MALKGYEDRVREAAQFIRSEFGRVPETTLVLGSGFACVAGMMDRQTQLPFSAIPHFPEPSVTSHRPVLSLGLVERRSIALIEGRVHLYEGFAARDVVVPVRALALSGSKRFLLTNAAGSIHRGFLTGTLMLIKDHINLQGTNPLQGVKPGIFGERFVDMGCAYDPWIREQAKLTAKALGIHIHEGVYAAVPGPSFETPAEVRMLRCLGADAVGMSTVLEVIALRQMKKAVGAVSCLTNQAAGISRHPLSHTEVIEAVAQQQTSIGSFLKSLILRL